MFYRLTGYPLVIGDNLIALELSGVCYELHCSKASVKQSGDPGYRTSDQGMYSFFIHEHITEEKYDLYGFMHDDEMVLFRQLLKVNGIGPKAALAVCDLGTVENVKQMIRLSAVDALSAARGISKARAQTICLELGKKV